MDSNGSKGLCMALLFLDTLLFGWPPYFLVRGENQTPRSIRIRTIIISYLSCFAGGVFLGACLLHLLAEGREVMESYMKLANITIDFPVYEAVVAGGFFAIAIVEQIAHNLLHKSRHVRQNSQSPFGKQEYSQYTEEHNSGSFNLERRAHTDVDHTEGVDNPAFVTDNKYHKDSSRYSEMPAAQEVESFKNGLYSSIGGSFKKDSLHKTNSHDTKETAITTVIDSEGDRRLSVSKSSVHNDHTPMVTSLQNHESAHDHDNEVVGMIQIMEVNPLRAFLLLGALSFHTIFDGLAVGLQNGDTDIWEMFTAICIHKSLVAVCLGLQLFLAFKSKPIMGFAWVFFFSLMSPIGVGIGMILSSGNIDEEVETLVNWILQGMATGTFLYVTFFEILQEEFAKKDGVLKIFVTMLGFGGMAVAKYFDQD